MQKVSVAYTTAKEIEFLGDLPLPRLTQYLAATERRTDWGSMNADEVRTYCQRRIATLQERRERR